MSQQTAAGERTVDLLPRLHDELATLAATRRSENLDAFVFETSTGRRRTASNARQRVFGVAVDRANGRFAARSIEPLPERLTPRSLRRTFASLLRALGETPPRVIGPDGTYVAAVGASDIRSRNGPSRRRAGAPAGAGTRRNSIAIPH